MIQVADQVEQCGLAGVGGSHQRDEFSGGHIQVELMENVDGFSTTPIMFHDLLQLNGYGHELLLMQQLKFTPGTEIFTGSLSESQRIARPLLTVSDGSQIKLDSVSAARWQ